MSSVNILLCGQRLLVNVFKSPVLPKQHISYALSRQHISKWLIQSRSISNSRHHDFNTERAVSDKVYKNKVFKDDSKDAHLSDDHDPDVFGTMDKNFKLNRKLEEMPEEEDDVSETVLYNEKDERRGRLTMNKYGKIIKYFLDKKKLGNAIDVLETRMLKEDKAKPDKYIYNLLISGCAKYGYTRKAFQLFNDMKKRGLTPSASTYTSLFNACSTSPWTHDGVKRLKRLRELILEKGYTPNQQNYHAMIKAYGRCKDVESAFNVVDEMIEKNILVTTETFNFLLQACITDDEAGLRHGILVWNKMLSKGLKPDLYSFNLILRCTRDCGLGSLEATTDVIQTITGSSGGTSKLLEGGNSNRVFVDNNSVENNDVKLFATHEEKTAVPLKSSNENLVENCPNLLSKHPHLGDIIGLTDIKLAEHRLLLLGGFEGVLREMKLNGVKPDIKTFTQLLEAMPSTLSAEKNLLKRIEENKIKPDIDFFNILVKKRSMRCDYENSRAVLKLIQKHLLSPDIVTFGVLALSCFKTEDVDQLIQDMDEIGYRMNIQILGALLRNASVSWNIDCIVKIMRLLLDENITPSPQFMGYLWHFYSSVLKYKKMNENKNFSENDKKFIDKVNDKEFMAQFQHYCIFYKKWRNKALPAEPEHPFSQFQKHDLDAEELAVMNRGRSSR